VEEHCGYAKSWVVSPQLQHNTHSILETNMSLKIVRVEQHGNEISWGVIHLVLPLHVPGSLQVLLQQRSGGVLVAHPQGRAQQTLRMDKLNEEARINTARDMF
jgi:hypothetical protein